MCLNDLKGMTINLEPREGEGPVTEADVLGTLKALAGLWAVCVGRRRDTAMVQEAITHVGSFAASLKRRGRLVQLMGWEALHMNVRRWCAQNGREDLVIAADGVREREALDRLLEDLNK